MNSKDVKKKLKLEKVEVCLNCERFVNCQDVGELEQCERFLEIKDESWVIRKI